MMSGVPFDTCWAFKKLWNNKFYYKAASCWYLYWVIYEARIHEYQIYDQLFCRYCFPPMLKFPPVSSQSEFPTNIVSLFVCTSLDCKSFLSYLRWRDDFNPLNAELNPVCHLLALLGVHFLHVSRIRVKHHLAQRTNHGGVHYVIFAVLCLVFLSSMKTFLSEHCYQTLLILLKVLIQKFDRTVRYSVRMRG